MAALGSSEAMRMESPISETDWYEDSDVVRYNGTAIAVYYTIHDAGLDIDGIEHEGLTLESDDLSERMCVELVAILRAKWDRETEAS